MAEKYMVHQAPNSDWLVIETINEQNVFCIARFYESPIPKGIKLLHITIAHQKALEYAQWMNRKELNDSIEKRNDNMDTCILR